MKLRAKAMRRIIGDKPDSFKGTRYDWSQLIQGLLEAPDPNMIWTKDKKTGVWSRETIGQGV